MKMDFSNIHNRPIFLKYCLQICLNRSEHFRNGQKQSWRSSWAGMCLASSGSLQVKGLMRQRSRLEGCFLKSTFHPYMTDVHLWPCVAEQFAFVNTLDQVTNGVGGVIVSFYWCRFERTEMLWQDPEACCSLPPPPSLHVTSQFTAPCCKDLYTTLRSWKQSQLLGLKNRHYPSIFSKL